MPPYRRERLPLIYQNDTLLRRRWHQHRAAGRWNRTSAMCRCGCLTTAIEQAQAARRQAGVKNATKVCCGATG